MELRCKYKKVTRNPVINEVDSLFATQQDNDCSCVNYQTAKAV